MARKILIIEDEEIICDILSSKLRSEGYEISSAKDGESGLEKIKRLRPDLVLLDIIMPKMNGFFVLEQKSLDATIAKIPVIIISNSGQPVEIERAKTLGVKDWLVKADFDPEQVIDKVIQQIGKA
ncbi:MAG TPA: response regulator [Candidatus Pacearchaeota archaeon]|mgnify:CR=1 FL=1|nr:response regulator [Candidatus Pacearchaeota archaeon]